MKWRRWFYGCLHRWYRFAAPTEPPPGASLARREVTRRGKLGSLILLLVIYWTLAAVPSGLTSKNHFLLPVLLGTVLVDCVALWFNKQGRINIAGVMAAAAVNISYAVTLLNAPTGLTPANLMNYDMLIQSVLIIVSLLPARSAFVMALINTICIVLDITFQARTAELNRLFATAGYSLVSRPILLQFIVAFVAFLWVHSAMQAIRRADRAEEVAALQRNIAEQKRQLDMGIQQILQTHIHVANGDFRVRAPLTEENVLWQIAFSLNNLLARMQRYSQLEQQLQKAHSEVDKLMNLLHMRATQSQEREQEIMRMQAEITRLVKVLHVAKVNQSPIWSTSDETMLEPLVQALVGNYIGKYIPSMRVSQSTPGRIEAPETPPPWPQSRIAR